MLPLFDKALDAIGVIGNLIDDAWDTEAEKADRELAHAKARGQVEVAVLHHQLARQEAVHRVAEAQARAASAQAAGKSWLQRTLFPICTYGVVGVTRWFKWHGREVPIEALAIWLVVAGGGVIDHRLFEWIRGRRVTERIASR